MKAADRCREQIKQPIDQIGSGGHLRVPKKSALTKLWACSITMINRGSSDDDFVSLCVVEGQQIVKLFRHWSWRVYSLYNFFSRLVGSVQSSCWELSKFRSGTRNLTGKKMHQKSSKIHCWSTEHVKFFMNFSMKPTVYDVINHSKHAIVQQDIY